jgi:preprotein translocase subunit SecD
VAFVVVLCVGLATQASAQSPGPPSPVPIGDITVVIVQLQGAAGTELTPEQQATAVATIEARLAALPDAGTTTTPLDAGRIRLDLADPTHADLVSRVATAPGEFRIIGIPSDFADQVEPGGPLPSPMPIDEVVGPGHVASAAIGEDQMGRPAIDLRLDDEAAQAFDDWAAGHYAELIALVLDGVVRSAATINAAQFDGQIQVSGSFELPEAQELVAILAGGPLPVSASVMTLCPAPAGCPVPSAEPEASAAS